MIDSNNIEAPSTLATIIKPCPLCGGFAVVAFDATRLHHGVRCLGCQANLPAIFESAEEAINAWCQRRGTAAFAGGKATRGILTKKKQRASLRNLRAARKARKLKWLKDRRDTTGKVLRMFRQIELSHWTAKSLVHETELRKLCAIVPPGHKLRPILDIALRWHETVEKDVRAFDSMQAGHQ
jgi:hypothetical protein